MENFDKSNPYRPNAKKPLSKKTIITGSLFILFSLFLIFKLISGNNSEQTSNEIKKYTKEDALAHSQVFIESKLSSPASAKFDSSIEEIVQINDTIFRVNSFVDSQNGFGALIRSKYSCNVIFHPKTDTHDIINVKID